MRILRWKRNRLEESHIPGERLDYAETRIDKHGARGQAGPVLGRNPLRQYNFWILRECNVLWK